MDNHDIYGFLGCTSFICANVWLANGSYLGATLYLVIACILMWKAAL